MSHDVFISYSSLDKPAADAVCHGLEAKGIRCWIAPRDQVAGQPFGQQITAAISSAQVMVLVFSDNVNKSHAVHNEVGIAANANVTIVPFRIASVDFNPELNFYLGRMHWLDAFPQSVDHYIDNLAATVRRNLTPAADSAATTSASAAIPTPSAPPRAMASTPAKVEPAARKPMGIGSWVAIIFGALVLLVIVDRLVLHPRRVAGTIPAIAVKGDDGTTVTVGPAGVTVMDANSMLAPSAPPKPGQAPDPNAVRYYETVVVPGGPPSDIEDASVIDTAKLAQRLQERADGKRAVILIDTRGCSAKTSLPGAYCLEPTDVEELKAKISDKDVKLVIFCDDGRCSSAYALAGQAVAAGYEDVDWYRGGVNAWISSGGPLRPLTRAQK
jgi:rhodanese-related sulfurtransferase